MESAESITQLRSGLLALTQSLYGVDWRTAWMEVKDYLAPVHALYSEVISWKEQLQQAGVEVPGEILLAQLHHFIEAWNESDVLQMADVLQYEVNAGLEYCEQIVGMMEHK